jgi:hypothetical protein
LASGFRAHAVRARRDENRIRNDRGMVGFNIFASGCDSVYRRVIFSGGNEILPNTAD